MARPHAPRGEAKARVLEAALALYAVHGVSGTSLQMIADHLGVTKAAVYYQFQAKEDIAVALLAPLFDSLQNVVAACEAAVAPDAQLDVALSGLVDFMVDHRRMAAAMYRDPEMERLVATRPELQPIAQRLGEILLGPEPDPIRRTAVSMLGAGLPNPGIDQALRNVDDQTLRVTLLVVARRTLGLSPTPTEASGTRAQAPAHRTLRGGSRASGITD